MAPGAISDETAKKLEEHWNTMFSGPDNIGKVAVLGDNLKYEKMEVMSAVDAQVIEQLKWDDEKIAATFHVPGYMVNVGQPPTGDGYEARQQQYYSQACQVLIEAMELCLAEGIGADVAGYDVEYDLEALVRMDAATKMKLTVDGIKGGIFTPNEGRQRWNLPPIKGGDTVYLQEQDHSLSWLAERDALGPPPVVKPAPVQAQPTAPASPQPEKSVRVVGESELFGGVLEEMANV
jgi:HK97 family phage portal protein